MTELDEIQTKITNLRNKINTKPELNFRGLHKQFDVAIRLLERYSGNELFFYCRRHFRGKKISLFRCPGDYSYFDVTFWWVSGSDDYALRRPRYPFGIRYYANKDKYVLYVDVGKTNPRIRAVMGVMIDKVRAELQKLGCDVPSTELVAEGGGWNLYESDNIEELIDTFNPVLSSLIGNHVCGEFSRPFEMLTLDEFIHDIKRAIDKVNELLDDPEAIEDSVPEFFMEVDLEDRIEKNPSIVEDGLRIIERQANIGIGKIDLLGENNGELVVIELKRKHAHDRVTGQIQTYMNYLRQNRAKTGQKVRGIIIAKEMSERLLYAVGKNIRLLEYYFEHGELRFREIMSKAACPTQ